ncbi:MAG TPA: sigma factor-like helix-turn-helix DNA-binding protein [Labilithrix sp.]|nr:sigma factor-like helix-turn-helix DNA-binding protein [Labilithrix sp.]
MLVRHFLGGREGEKLPADLERQLEEKVRSARSAWPGVAVAPEDFVARLGEVVAGDGASLEAIHSGDLWLALGCLARDAHAETAFERDVMTAVRPAVDRVSGKGVSADDVLQATREKLLVGGGPDGSPPKLAQYTGRGPLVGWVRVVAVREALYAQRSKRHVLSADDAELLAPERGKGGIELEVLRARHGEAFREAVQDALRRLTSEQRTLLRFHTHDGLTIDQLAPMLGVHRATAARRLEKARSDAMEHTRAILRERSGLSESEARSLCIALASEVDVSIGRALMESTAT